MSILDRLTEDMKQAMKSGEKERLGTIRLLRGQIKDASIYQQKELSEEEELAVLTNAAKKRRESIEAFQNAGRTDLVEKESFELKIIQSYLPEQLGPDIIEKIVQEAIQETGAQTIKDLGKVMPVLMAKIKGRADGKLVSQLVKNKLGM
jgi:uncharacterized protein